MEQAAEDAGGFGIDLAATLGEDVDGEAAEVGHDERLHQQTAVGVGVHAHAAAAFGREIGEVGAEAAFLVEELFGLVAAHPVFEELEVVGLLENLAEGDLMGAPGAFDGLAVDEFGAGPALGGAEDEHGPARALGAATFAGGFLDGGDAVEHGVEQGGHLLVHGFGVVAFQSEGLVAVAAHQVFELGVGDAGEDGGVGDLVAVEMKDGQNRAVGGGVEELVRVPACGEGAGFGFAIANDTSDEQVGVVERRAVGMDEGVAELAALMDGAGGFGRDVAGNAKRPTELAEETLDAVGVLLYRRVKLSVGTFKVGVGHQAWATVAGADDVDHVQVALVDGAVEVDVEEIEPRRGAPVAEQARLYIVQGERLLEKRITLEIDLAHGKIVGGAPVGVHAGEGFGVQGLRGGRVAFGWDFRGKNFFSHPVPRLEKTASTKMLAPGCEWDM